jgi:hypothetical protein
MAVGALLALVFTLSPLTVIAGVLLALLLNAAALGLPPEQRKWLRITLSLAILLRVLAILALLLVSDHDTQAAAILTGDEAYSLSRILRVRNILLGIPALKYDYQIAYESYGETSYLTLLTVLQVLFGPSPYGLRLVNVLLFIAGATLLFHLARVAYGRLPAYIALAGLVLLPTLFLWSIALLKESLYFALSASVLAAVYAAFRAPDMRWRIAAAIGAAAALWALHDLRAGAVYLVGGGASLGVLGYFASRTPRRFVIAVLGAVILAIVLVTQTGVMTRLRAAVDAAARVQIGHVFTVGHAYKTLDEGFYVKMEHFATLTPDEAARYVVRSLVSFLVVPWPWRMEGKNELAFMPEHVLWYVSLVLALVGVIGGLARDRLATCLLVGIMIPTSLVVALTNGNVGTLIRFRGLDWPYLLVLASLGACIVLQRLLDEGTARASAASLRSPILGEPI